MKMNQTVSNAVLLAGVLGLWPAAQADTFTSGSNGSDGALNLAADQGEIQFDPKALNLDKDGDHIFHFTTITIGSNTTVRLSARHFNGPVFWLAKGDVDIQGTLDLNGRPGQRYTEVLNNGMVLPAEPGAGGYSGGVGEAIGDGTAFAAAGNGPGGGVTTGSTGGGATHQYGTRYCVPLVGGSGGGGGRGGSLNTQAGGGGGGGGGAICIASSTSISVRGRIQATGGSGGEGWYSGGGGSGGEIRLVAPVIVTGGSLEAGGGAGVGSVPDWWTRSEGGQVGRIRIESFSRTMPGPISPQPFFGAPYNLFLPTTPPPSLAVTSVGGVAIQNPTASFITPDAVLASSAPVDIVVQAARVPPGTPVILNLFPTDGSQLALTNNLAGTLQASSVTFSVALPSGHTRGHARAVWTP